MAVPSRRLVVVPLVETLLADPADYSERQQWLAVRAAILCRVVRRRPGRFILLERPEA